MSETKMKYKRAQKNDIPTFLPDKIRPRKQRNIGLFFPEIDSFAHFIGFF